MLNKKHNWTFPVVKGNWLIGNTLEFRNAPLATLHRLATEYGDLVAMPILHENFIIVNHPDGIREILVSKREDWSRAQNLEVPYIRQVVGEGPLTSDGATWRRLRKAIWPSFRPNVVPNNEAAICQAVQETLVDWKRFGGKVKDLFPNMLGMTIRITFASMFASSLDYKKSMKLAEASLIGQSAVYERIRSPWGLPAPFPTLNNLAFKQAVGVLESTLEELIARSQKQESQADAIDLWSVMQNHREPETGAPLCKTEIHSQLFTMLLAAPENMAATLTWTLYLLARHPEIEAKLREELEVELQGRKPSLAEVRQLKYLNRVLFEVMRLYPGAPYFDRRAVKDTKICGHSIPKGTIAMIAPYTMHRSEKYWKDPEVFNPDRFQDMREARKDVYIPFGAGPRRCIGEHFALITLQLALPMLLGAFKFKQKNNKPVPIAPAINLRPKGGMRMRFQTLV